MKAVSGGGTESGSDLGEKLQIDDKSVFTKKVTNLSPNVMRNLVDQIRDMQKEKTIALVMNQADGKLSLCLGLTKDLTGKMSAGDLIKKLAQKFGGTGGGRPDFAQAGGIDQDRTDDILNELKKLVQQP